VTDGERAVELYRLALSVVEQKGRFIAFGLTTYREYRGDRLSIRYLPSTGHMDVYARRKLLTVNRQQGELRVVYYAPGEWETELESLATKPLKN
jgi:hypothetical protein